MGRPIKMHCPSCGVQKTDKNTYRRASGLFAAFCKPCSKTTAVRANMVKQAKAGGGKKWLAVRIKQTEAVLSLYRDILNNWK